MYSLRRKTHPFVHIMLTGIDQFRERIGRTLGDDDIRNSGIMLGLININVITGEAEAECHDIGWPACDILSKMCFVAEPDVGYTVHKSLPRDYLPHLGRKIESSCR